VPNQQKSTPSDCFLAILPTHTSSEVDTYGYYVFNFLLMSSKSYGCLSETFVELWLRG